jgi:hypothetical protein
MAIHATRRRRLIGGASAAATQASVDAGRGRTDRDDVVRTALMALGWDRSRPTRRTLATNRRVVADGTGYHGVMNIGRIVREIEALPDGEGEPLPLSEPAPEPEHVPEPVPAQRPNEG